MTVFNFKIGNALCAFFSGVKTFLGRFVVDFMDFLYFVVPFQGKSL